MHLWKWIEVAFYSHANTPKNDSLYRFKRRIYGLSVQNVLFSLLEENNYNINYEAKEFMRMNHLKNRISGQLYENDIINMFLCSPYIEGIGSSKKGSFIRLKDVGDFSLGYADYEFRKNITINEYINNERLMLMVFLFIIRIVTMKKKIWLLI